MRGSVTSCYISWLLLLETPTGGEELGSYHLLDLLLTQEAPVWPNHRLLYLLVFTSWDPNWGRVGQLFSFRPFFCHQKLVRGSVPSCYISWLLLIDTPVGVGWGRYHLLELLLTQEAPAWSSRRLLYILVFTSWELNRDKVGKLFSIRAFLSQEARARISHKLLYLQVVTSWDPNWGGSWAAITY